MPWRVAGSDGFAEYLNNKRTPTERAIYAYKELRSLWEKVEAKERELAVLLTNPKVDMNEYYRARGNED